MTQPTLYADPPAEPAPLTEPEKAAATLAYLEAEHHDVLTWLRVQLVKTYRFRLADNPLGAYVTADDARQHLPRCPYTVPTCKNFLGALFKGAGWKAVGFLDHRSETPGSHGNRLMRWVYTGPLSDGGPSGRDPRDTIPRSK